MSLDQFDAEYNPSSMMRSLNVEALDDGNYIMRIEGAYLDDVELRSGQTAHVLRWKLKVLEGESSVDCVVDNTTWLNSTSINMLGADLFVLGFPSDKWTPDHGSSFSKGLQECVPNLKGVTFRCSKVTNERNGRVYHNLRIRGLAAQAGNPMPVDSAKVFEADSTPAQAAKPEPKKSAAKPKKLPNGKLQMTEEEFKKTVDEIFG